MTKPNDTDEYIKGFPAHTRKLMQELRDLIKSIAPEAVEVISYAMPSFKWKGRLVYFAAFKNHIGFYPGAASIAAFRQELSIYKNAKGSVQFPLDNPLPVELVTKMVEFKMNENLQKSKLKK